MIFFVAIIPLIVAAIVVLLSLNFKDAARQVEDSDTCKRTKEKIVSMTRCYDLVPLDDYPTLCPTASCPCYAVISDNDFLIRIADRNGNVRDVAFAKSQTKIYPSTSTPLCEIIELAAYRIEENKNGVRRQIYNPRSPRVVLSIP